MSNISKKGDLIKLLLIKIKRVALGRGRERTHIITCFLQANHTKRLDYFNSST